MQKWKIIGDAEVPTCAKGGMSTLSSEDVGNFSSEDGENFSSEPKQSVMLSWTVGQIGAILWKENKDRFLDTPLENTFWSDVSSFPSTLHRIAMLSRISHLPLQ